MEYKDYELQTNTEDTTAFFPVALYGNGSIIDIFVTWEDGMEKLEELEKGQDIKAQIEVEFMTMENILKLKFGMTEVEARTEIWTYIQESDFK